MRSTTVLALTGMLSLATAQNSTAQSSDTYQIDPNSVSLGTRESWCSSQTSACPLICLQTVGNTQDPTTNTCDPATLSYSCVCSNGISPNASQYSQTLPYFICTEWGNQCVTACGSDSQCASDCRSNHPCGAQDPPRINTTTATTMSQTSTGTASVSTDSADGGSAATSSSGAGRVTLAAVEVGQAYGLVVVVAGFFGGFALLL